MINPPRTLADAPCVLCVGEKLQRSCVSWLSASCRPSAASQREPQHRQSEHCVSVQNQQIRQRASPSSAGGETHAHTYTA